ncbi:MAG: tartrate dehydrogenase [Actinobacteria bacterium]|nr:tartrate dehydrogenase [Actinomycetota bacterium]
MTSEGSARRLHRVAVIPGDGIGVETTAAALEVLAAAAGRWGFELELERFPWGCDHYVAHGRMMPVDALDRLGRFEAIMLGAVGRPDVPDAISIWELIMPIRRRFDQFVNVRPVRRLDGIRSPLSDRLAAAVDLVVVRENTEGEYSEIGGVLRPPSNDEVCLQVAGFSRTGCERVARYAFQLAGERRGRLVSATKSNGLPHSMPFWDAAVRSVAAEFPAVELRSVHVDALAAAFVLEPAELDVVVASNLFGDILSEIGAAVVGGIGIGSSANLDPTGRHPSMFEPIHGSAPDIAGLGIADPIGQIWSAAMMLRHLGEVAAAGAIMASIEAVLAAGEVLTPDLGGSARTAAVTAAVVERLAATDGDAGGAPVEMVAAGGSA